MKILYCGALWAGGTCAMRKRALERLGYEVYGVDTSVNRSLAQRIAGRVAREFRWWMDHAGANDRMLAEASRVSPDVVWIDNGQTIQRGTLRELRRRLPNTRILHYSPDDMMAQHNQSVQYLQCITEYDLHATTKTYNIQELRALGARAVTFVNNAYCPETHRPMVVSAERRAKVGGIVGFIGAFEAERSESILALADHGIQVRIWGGWSGARHWGQPRFRHPNIIIERSGVYGAEYVEAICSFDINLGFLRKMNRDLQTTRSMEVPACGAFLLAERTDEHRGLFEEGLEAEFFGSDEELVNKCKRYLKDGNGRSEIAKKGRWRCIKSDYSYDAQVNRILSTLEKVVVP